jgi:hypothetical protein
MAKTEAVSKWPKQPQTWLDSRWTGYPRRISCQTVLYRIPIPRPKESPNSRSPFNNDSEFAQVGDITFATESGTNQLHGNLFEYLQNDAFDARILNFSVKAPKRFNIFGGSVGGPLLVPKLYNGKDKTFFFFDYEGNPRRTATPQQFLP